MEVIFDTLEFSDDLTKILLACHLDEDMVDAGYSIQAITIESFKNRLATGIPSSKALIIPFQGGETEYDTATQTQDGGIPIGDVNHVTGDVATSFEKMLFYIVVWVGDGGDVQIAQVRNTQNTLRNSASTEYDWLDWQPFAGVLLDWKTFYDIGMGYVVSMTRRCNKYSCEIPAGFEQFILLWHAFQLAYEAKDLEQLDFLWGRLMGQGNVDTKCNCG